MNVTRFSIQVSAELGLGLGLRNHRWMVHLMCSGAVEDDYEI